MKKSALLLGLMILVSFTHLSFAQESLEVGPGEKAIVGEELQKEADSHKLDEKTKALLHKVALVFKKSDSQDEVEVLLDKSQDCSDCTNQEKLKFYGTKVGRGMGKGSAWVSTITAKPFMNAAGFLTGFFEKSEKNQALLGLHQFLINHHEEFDTLYMEAGTAEDLVNLVLGKIDEIMKRKSRLVMIDLLASLGIKRSSEEGDLALTQEELKALDLSKLDPGFVNSHPEYQELKPLLGEMTQEKLNEIVTYNYFDTALSFDQFQKAMPKIHEGVITIVGQIFAPKIVLGIISKTLGALYALPVVAADIGTGVSVAICLQASTQDKFESDSDLKLFCSYVVNRTAYELEKSRAKGYVGGKKVRSKVEKKVDELKKRHQGNKGFRQMARMKF